MLKIPRTSYPKTEVKPLQLIPDWLGDETLYSWSSRAHRMLCASTKDTGRILFGIGHAYRELAVSTNLIHFSKVTEGRLGSTRDILLRRTSLGAFYPFLRREQQKAFDDFLEINDKKVAWLHRFGMRTSSLVGNEMRWCPECVKRDIERWGTSTWRTPHQLPGAWWCYEHDTLLQAYEQKRAEWSMPGESILKHDYDLNQQEREVLMTLSTLAASLISVLSVDLPSIKNVILTQLREIGVLSFMKPINAEDLNDWFYRTSMASAIRKLDPKLLPVTSSTWVYELLLNRRADHPLLWMILCVSAFERLHKEVVVQSFYGYNSSKPWQEDGQGLLWNEDVFRGDTRIQEIVRRATTIEEAASQLNVSVATVTKYMKKAQFNARYVRQIDRMKARLLTATSAIETYVKLNPTATRNEVRSKCISALVWLKRSAPDTLNAIWEKIPEKNPIQQSLNFDID